MTDQWSLEAPLTWVVSRHGRTLHHLASGDADPNHEMATSRGRTTCGLRGFLRIPGLYPRLNLPRCRRCCALTGTRRGDGSPLNQKEDRDHD